MSSEKSPTFLLKGGHYQELLSYRKSEIVYDFTFRFCEKFLKRGDRTIDQMVQAARSGKQNILHLDTGIALRKARTQEEQGMRFAHS